MMFPLHTAGHWPWAIGLATLLHIGCSDELRSDPAPVPTPDAVTEVADSPRDTDATAPPTLIDEAEAAGLLRYLDGPMPVIESEEGDTTVYLFGEEDGPLCMRGDPYRVSVRDTGSPNLLVFLQGGGACWSHFCLAVTGAPAGVPPVDALNPELEGNPLADWNVVYLPYCDGSFFVGDRDHDDNGDGEDDRLHRGLQNLSGALRVALERFPQPERILLTGSSAGGFGTIPATMVLRAAYPETHIDIFNDSGVGIARPSDEVFIRGALEEFGVDEMLPPSCVDCTGNGHITRLVEWTLERDEDIRIAVFSAYYDSIIAEVFLEIPPENFRDALIEETEHLRDRFQGRYRRFLVDGTTHTALLGDPSGIIGSDFSTLELPDEVPPALMSVEIGSLEGTTIGEVSVGMWLDAFVRDDPGWVDLTEAPGDPGGN